MLGDPIRSCRVKRNNVQRGATTYESPKLPQFRPATCWPRPLAPTGMGEMWAYDFVFDACANGQQLKCLTVIDDRGSRQAHQRAWSSAIPEV